MNMNMNKNGQIHKTSGQPHILLAGINHETAPVEVREAIAFQEHEIPAALDSVLAIRSVHEAILLSTCNRIEVLFTADDPSDTVPLIIKSLAGLKKIDPKRIEPHLYMHEDKNAVRHIFRVASGLDSMVMGEPQIFGQVKSAYRLAVEQNATGVILNRLTHKTFLVAKRVRTETGIGGSAVSISYAAVELAKKIFGSLDGKSVLLIGAGEMAELAVEHLAGNRVGSIHVANRTFERAVELAGKYNGRAVSFEEIPDILSFVDIVVSSTGAPGFIISREQVRRSMRGRRNNPIFFIDIAVPRDIDPDVNRVANAYVYDIDDLKSVVDENISQRHREAVKAKRIIEESALSFMAWYESLDVVPTVVALRNKITRIAESETRKTLGSALKHLTQEDKQAVQRMTEAIINKILHDPTTFLKNSSRKEKHRYLDITKRLFKLESGSQKYH